jgi:hypothetical protein
MTANRSDQREPPCRMSGGASPRPRPATTSTNSPPVATPSLPPDSPSSLRAHGAVFAVGTIADVKPEV